MIVSKLIRGYLCGYIITSWLGDDDLDTNEDFENCKQELIEINMNGSFHFTFDDYLEGCLDKEELEEVKQIIPTNIGLRQFAIKNIPSITYNELN